MATRVLTAMYAVGIMDSKQPTGSSAANATSVGHAALAQHLAEQAAALLRNEGAILPLQSEGRVAVIGAMANCTAPPPSIPNWGWPRSAGCLNSGGGSGSVDASYVRPILSAIQHRHSIQHSDRARDGSSVEYDDGTESTRAAKVAAAADVAIVVVGTSSGESHDRNGTSLPQEQLTYLRAVAAVQPRTVVVVSTDRSHSHSRSHSLACQCTPIATVNLTGMLHLSAVCPVDDGPRFRYDGLGRLSARGAVPVHAWTRSWCSSGTTAVRRCKSERKGVLQNVNEKLRVKVREQAASRESKTHKKCKNTETKLRSSLSPTLSLSPNTQQTPVTMPRKENEMSMSPEQYPGLDSDGKQVGSWVMLVMEV
jgi:hypothetical protein